MEAKSFPDPGSGKGEPGELDEDEPEEAREARQLCSPLDPTVADILLHKVNHHLPFRNWCPQCVAAKGRERDHKRPSAEDIAAEEHALTQYGLDYAFFSEEPEYELVRVDDEKKVEEDKVLIKVAAMKEKKTGSRFAHMAQAKGESDDYVAEALAEDIETMGGGPRLS